MDNDAGSYVNNFEYLISEEKRKQENSFLYYPTHGNCCLYHSSNECDCTIKELFGEDDSIKLHLYVPTKTEVENTKSNIIILDPLEERREKLINYIKNSKEV